MPRKSFPSSAEKIESVFQFWYCIFIHFKPYALYGKHPVGARIARPTQPSGRPMAAPTGCDTILRCTRRGRCPHRPVRAAAWRPTGGSGSRPYRRGTILRCTRRGRCPHRPVRAAAWRPTGGSESRPYRRGTILRCTRRGRCPHRPVRAAAWHGRRHEGMPPYECGAISAAPCAQKNARRHEAAGRGGFTLTHPGRSRNRARCS